MLDLITRTLAALEQLEAEQINLGCYTTRVTPGDLRERLRAGGAPEVAEDEVRGALQCLIDRGEVLMWSPGLFRSRVGETVRLLRLLRQRFWQRSLADSPLLIEDVRVEFRQRRRPRRDAVPFERAIPAHVPPALTVQLQSAIRIPHLSVFQTEAIREIYACAQGRNSSDQAFIIAGDTGAGKTEAFLFPILFDIAGEPPDERRRPGVRAVLVYPRIRLARNQLGRMLRYVTRLAEAGGPQITVGIQNGDTPAGCASLGRRWKSEQRGGRDGYLVGSVETCVECGQGRYWVAADDPALDTGCPQLRCSVCDHTVACLFLTQAALANSAPDLLVITDVSLSQWLARERYAHLWGLWDPEQATVPPRYLVLDEVHLYQQIKGAHIARLIKRFQARVRLVYKQTEPDQRNPILIGVSATLNDERAFLAKLLDIPQRSPRLDTLRVIKPQPADLVETNGRERYIFIRPRRLSPTPRKPQYRVNDQTAAIQIVMAAMHNLKRSREWRGLAFFDSLNDLRQFRHTYDAGGPSDDRDDDVFPAANQAQLWRIRTDAVRRENGRTVHMRQRCGGECAQRLSAGTLGECLHFNSGDCWVPAKAGGWNEQLNVADSVYAGAAAALDGADLIPTSPSLEVGYDDDAIQLVYQHKAPPSAASFIQRRGRAGRNPDDSPVIMTMLWPHRSGDMFYFYRPQELYSPTFDDAPLNAGNFTVQRTHALLALFDLLSCLRRQNIDGIRDDPAIIDFTQAGSQELALLAEVVHEHRWLPDPKRPGSRRMVITRRQSRQPVWLSGNQLNYVRESAGHLRMQGWLAMNTGLTFQVLRAVWRRLGARGQDGAPSLLERYLESAEIASAIFRRHRSYPFLVPLAGSLPGQLLRTFGNPEWHSSREQSESGNWLKTYRHIDWMLQGSEDATTLIVHIPEPDVGEDGLPPERTVEVTFGLTELLPGNVSYRLRDEDAIHWTPIPPDHESTFCYPEEPVDEDTPDQGGRLIAAYAPEIGDITSKPESIFGVPRYLNLQFPGLPFMTVKRLRVERFGAPDRQISQTWFFDRERQCAVAAGPGEHPPANAFRIARRSSARASSVVIPYIAAAGSVPRRNLDAPLDVLFGAIEGYVSEGAGMLGYTRVFYEMQIDVKAERHEDSTALRRFFYPPQPQRDEAGLPLPILVGYAVETHGIAFQLNPGLLDLVTAAIMQDTPLRLRLRRSLALYELASYAAEASLFLKELLDAGGVAIDYWIHTVVPRSSGEPRLLDPAADRGDLRLYFATHRSVLLQEVAQFDALLTEPFFAYLNRALELAFKDTLKFRAFAESVVLHSFSSLLKNLVARLGGVRAEDLIAYTDMPILEQVDRSINPRILIMDTVEGGSGAVAQAYDRLDLTAAGGEIEGSLWWLLQRDLGQCPVASGEALVRTVLSRATLEQIAAAQRDPGPASLQGLVEQLRLSPAPEALQALGRVLFSDIVLDNQTINPALIMRELFALHTQLDLQSPASYPREAVVRRAVSTPDQTERPAVAGLCQALSLSGVAQQALDHELAIQLMALYVSACEDGCPVCMSQGSDVEHYYLAPLLQSRQVLGKLREVLQASAPRNDCLAALASTLAQGSAVQVAANPGELGNRMNIDLGVAVVTNVDHTGQVSGSVAMPLDSSRVGEVFSQQEGWSEHWGGVEHCPFEAPDGTRVRSRADYIVATWLHQHGIVYQYQVPLPYRDERGGNAYIHPDFYLYEHNIYVEFWGRDGAAYLESRDFKERVYAQRGIVPVAIVKEELEGGRFMEKILARINPEQR